MGPLYLAYLGATLALVLAPGATTAVVVRNTLTGELRNVIGPCLYFPDAHDELVTKEEALPLKKNEYVRIVDTKTGAMRVERGEQSVYLGPTEELVGPVQSGVNIDERTAVLVRDTASGQLDLITAPQVWTRLGTDHYPWYPQTRVFSPRNLGDWTPAMAAVGEALAEKIGG